MTRRPGPVLSVDVVALTASTDGAVSILLPVRKTAPHRGETALPGVMMNGDETVTEAGHRALATKAGVDRSSTSYLRFVSLADAPGRDQRGPTVSVTHLAVLDQTATLDQVAVDEGDLIGLAEIPDELPFDHKAIIEVALEAAHDRLWSSGDQLARHLLGDEFTTTQAGAMLRSFDPGLDISNLGRHLGATEDVQATGERRSTGGRGRPSAVWRFTD